MSEANNEFPEGTEQPDTSGDFLREEIEIPPGAIQGIIQGFPWRDQITETMTDEECWEVMLAHLHAETGESVQGMTDEGTPVEGPTVTFTEDDRDLLELAKKYSSPPEKR